MKIIVRSLVIALAVTGVVASSYAKAPTATSTVKISKTSAMPIPSCAPGGDDGCGIGTW
jgi:hypothetical protein